MDVSQFQQSSVDRVSYWGYSCDQFFAHPWLMTRLPKPAGLRWPPLSPMVCYNGRNDRRPIRF